MKTPELLDEICERMSAGETLADVCRDKGVGRRTVYDWRDGDADFAARFARAREVGYDAIADDVLAIADMSENDYVKREDGSEAFNGEAVQRSKLRTEARFKLLAIWNPARFGSKVDVTSAGEKVQPTTMTVTFVKAPADPAG